MQKLRGLIIMSAMNFYGFPENLKQKYWKMFEITLNLTFWPIVEKLTCQLLAHVGHSYNLNCVKCQVSLMHSVYGQITYCWYPHSLSLIPHRLNVIDTFNLVFLDICICIDCDKMWKLKLLYYLFCMRTCGLWCILDTPSNSLIF